MFRQPFSITFVLLQLCLTSAAAKMPSLLRVRTVLCYQCIAIDFRGKFVRPKRHAAPSTGSTRPAQRFGNQKQKTAQYITGSALGDRRKLITILIAHGGLIKDRQCHICKIICVIHGNSWLSAKLRARGILRKLCVKLLKSTTYALLDHNYAPLRATLTGGAAPPVRVARNGA